VLRSWNKPMRVALSPDRVIVSRSVGGQLERGIIDCAPKDGAPAWSAALGALQDALKIAGRGARVSVILSNRLVRYLLIPCSRELTSDEELRAWVQHHFQKVFGAEASRQDFRWQTQGEGEPLVASAVDQTLLEALEATVTSSGQQLISVEPYFASSFNRFRHLFTHSSHWWALLEPQLMTLALMHGGRFASLRAHVAGPDWAERLPVWLERERAVCEHGQTPREVFVYAPEAAHGVWPERNGWDFRRLENGNAAGLAAYAMLAAGH
jgi:hypothetical protein